MMRRLAIPMLLCVLTTAMPAGAQEQATVLKRDGSRVSGRFEAWNRNNNSLYLRPSLGDQRSIPLGEAAMVEIAGEATNLPSSEIEAARGGDHVLVMRSGEVVRGRLQNIEGGEGSGKDDEPRMLTFKPNDGAERRARFSDVRRVYFGNFPASLSSTTATAPGQDTAADQPLAPGTVRVPGNERWVSANLTVRRTDRVQFTTQGQVQLSTDAEDKAGPAGSLRGRTAANAPLPSALAGALIGRIGTGAPFAIGDQNTPLQMPGDGQLYLSVNDDEVGDNSGAFTVTMQVTRTRR
jgi:hypothetical protein